MSIPDAQKVHARFSYVERRVWNDTRGLTPMKPSGMALWMYLLTTPYLGVLPGLIVAGEAMLAEHLGWSVGAFRKCFLELEERGMVVADWKARVIVLPKAIGKALAHGYPETVNVVKGWRRQWLEVPDFAGRDAYIQAVIDALRGSSAHGESYVSALLDAFVVPKGWGDPSPKEWPVPSPKDPASPSSKEPQVPFPNQDQDQDQDQDLRSPPVVPPLPGGDSPGSPLGVPSGLATVPTVAAEPPPPSGPPHPCSPASEQGVLLTVVPAPPAKAPRKARPKPTPEADPSAFKRVVDAYFQAFEQARESKPAFGAVEGRHVKRLIERVNGDVDRAVEAIRGAFSEPRWARERGDIAEIAAAPNRFLGRAAGQATDIRPRGKVVQSGNLPGADGRMSAAVANNW